MLRTENNKPVQLFDFDRTLFDTGRFFDDVWRYLHEKYGVDAMAQKRRMTEFHRYVGEWYDYDFFAHIASIPAIEKNIEMFTTDAIAALGTDYLFQDAASVIDACDAIVTFGNRPYQQFKMQFCRGIDELPKHIIQIEKGDFIRQQYGERAIVLVDDKPIEKTLSENVYFVRLDRAQTESVICHSPHYVSIRSLDSYQEALSARG